MRVFPMSNIVQRNLHRSLAKSLIEVEAETGVPCERLVSLMNEEFEYVDKDDQSAISALEKQMSLDVAAEKHAQTSKLKLSETAVALTAIKRKLGKLSSRYLINESEPEAT